jgi:hypothetical protein
MDFAGLIKDPIRANQRLRELGLTREILRNAVTAGQLAHLSCTANHPPLMRGVYAWGETIRSLREQLAPVGWMRSDANNFSLVVNDDRSVSIAVATGDDETGNEYGNPTTRSKKGPRTATAVLENSRQMPLFAELEVPAPLDPEQVGLTYFLLVRRIGERVRSELSLPTSIVDGRVKDWSERILLDDIEFDGSPFESDDLDLPDIDVEVIRRT